MPVTILVADDSATMRRIMEMTFAGEDADVVAVETGEIAIRKASELKPDVILADASMDGVDGYEVARAVKGNAALAQVVVLVMASQKKPYDEARGRAAGVDDHILKPFDTQQVIDRVTEVLARRKGVAAGMPAAGAPAASQSQSPLAAAGTQASIPKPSSPPVAGRGLRTATLAFGSGPLSGMPVSAPASQKPVAAGVPERSSVPPLSQTPSASQPAPISPVSPEPGVRPQVFGAGRTSAAPPAVTGRPAPVSELPAAAAAPRAGATASAEAEFAQKLEGLALSPEQVTAVLALSREVVERVVWEVVPDLAEAIIREEIKRLTQ